MRRLFPNWVEGEKWNFSGDEQNVSRFFVWKHQFISDHDGKMNMIKTAVLVWKLQLLWLAKYFRQSGERPIPFTQFAATIYNFFHVFFFFYLTKNRIMFIFEHNLENIFLKKNWKFVWRDIRSIAFNSVWKNDFVSSGTLPLRIRWVWHLRDYFLGTFCARHPYLTETVKNAESTRGYF